MGEEPGDVMRHGRRVLAALCVAGVLLLSAGRLRAENSSVCGGDCNGDGTVTVDELLVLVNIAVNDAPVAACARGDRNADGAITVDEILQAVNNALLACPASPTVFYDNDPQAADNPFPSDRLLDASGHVNVPGRTLDPGLPETAAYQPARAFIDNLAAQLHGFTGFGTYAPIRIPVGAPVAIDHSDNPSGIMLLDLSNLDGSPPAIRATFYAADNSVEVQPLLPLHPQTTYAVVVTTALQDTHGNPMQPSADFTALLGGARADLQPVRARLEPVISHLGAQGVGTDKLALIELFTTQAITDDLLAIRDRLDAGGLVPGPPVFADSPIPGLTTGIFPEGSAQFQSLVGAATSSNIAAVAIGSFDSYDFRTGPDGAFDPSLVSGPAIPGVNHLDFYMTIPKTPAPPQGYPIVIYGHGLYGSGRDVVNLAQTIGDAPMMGIAISAIHNGLRGEPTTFFVFDDPTATREYLRQTVADLLQLRRMIANAQQASTPPFDRVDPGHVLYFGGSLGAILGTMFMSLEPNVEVAMLSVPGGGLATALSSSYLTAIVTPHIVQQTGIAQADPLFPLMVHRLREIMQWAWDAGDPINYAPYVIAPGGQLPGVPAKHVLMHEGITDTIMPNVNGEALAAAFPLADLKASRGCSDPSGCSGIWRYVMSEYHKPPTAGHAVTSLIPQASAQAAGYLTSFGTVVEDATP